MTKRYQRGNQKSKDKQHNDQKIPKGKSEIEGQTTQWPKDTKGEIRNRRTDNTMTKRKRTNNDQQDNAQTTKDQARRIQTNKNKGPSWLWSYGSWIYYLCNQCLSPMMLWVRISIRARCTTLCDKVCQWLATDRWFPPVSSTNKTYRHDITEILLKVALNTIKQNKTN